MSSDINTCEHISLINKFHIDMKEKGEVKWHPFIYNGKITNYEASNTGLVRNKNTKQIFEKSKPTLKKLKRLAEKANNKLGEHYLRVTISNLKTEKRNKKKNLAVHKLVYCACNNIDYNDIPENQNIDHINRCRFDNRIINLRCVSRKENCKNRDTTNIKNKYHKFPIYLYKYGDKLKEIGVFNNAGCAANFLEEKTEYNTGNNNFQTIRGKIWNSIR